MAHGTQGAAAGAHLDEVYQLLPIAPVKGEDVWLVEASGRRILDLYGGHAVAVLGYGHPQLVRAIAPHWSYVSEDGIPPVDSVLAMQDYWADYFDYVEKKVPRDFITADGFGITAKARRYLSPLIAGEDYPPYRDGLPQYVRIRGKAVKKKLATEFKA